MPLVDEVDYGETVSTRFLLNVFSSASYSAQVSIIYYLNINSASPSDSNLVYSTIGSQHTYEKKDLRREEDITGMLDGNITEVS